MTTSKRLLALLMALAMCFALCACTSGEEPDEIQSPAESETPAGSEAPADPGAAEIEVDLTQDMYEFASGLKDGDTAVTVNGVAVPNELYLYWLSYDCYYMDYSYYQMGGYVDFSDESVRTYVTQDVQTAVTYYAILRELCQEAGITVTDEQMAEYEAMVASSIESSYGGDSDLFYQSYGLSPESLDYLYLNDYLYTNYMESMEQPTEGELEQYVNDSGIFGVKHILLQTVTAAEDGTLTLLDGSAPTNEDGSEYTGTAEDYNAAQLALAQSIVDQLAAAEDPIALFDELMQAHSEDTGLAAYPDGYTFTAEDSLVGGFREATLELEENEISGIVETDYGYHIMLRLPVDAASFADALLASRMDDLLSQRAEAAEVVVSDAITNLDVASFYERYMAYGNALFQQLSAQTTQATS